MTEELVRESFFIRVPKDAICLSHNGMLFFPAFPPGVALLTEPRVNATSIWVAKLTDQEGDVVGTVTAVEEFMPGSDLDARILKTRTLCTLVIPGRGTITLDEIENQSVAIANLFGPAMESGNPWRGNWSVITTVGPGRDGKGVIVGGTGEFYGAEGTAQEVNSIKLFDPTEGSMDLVVELQLCYRAKNEPEPFELPALQTVGGSPTPIE